MTVTSPSGRAAAYAACEAITRTEARNFFYGIRLLPPPKRQAMTAVYALARRIDDIGDGDQPTPVKLDQLDRVQQDLARIDAGGEPDPDSDPVLFAVADAGEQFALPLDAFQELVTGVRMDVQGRSYASFEELVEYCRCVAGSIGRLCLAVFAGSGFGRPVDPEQLQLADTLGIALQQINILRDIREDLGNGRVYLPADELQRFGVSLSLDGDGRLQDAAGALAALIHARAGEARDWLCRGLTLVPRLDRRSAACCAAMAGIYARLLDRIDEEPERVYGSRLSLSGWEKGRVAVRALAGRPASPPRRAG